MNFDKYTGPPTPPAATPAAPARCTSHDQLPRKLGRSFAETAPWTPRCGTSHRGYKVLEKREVSAQEANKLIGVSADPGPTVAKTGTVNANQWGHQDPVDVTPGAAFKVTMTGTGDATSTPVRRSVHGHQVLLPGRTRRARRSPAAAPCLPAPPRCSSPSSGTPRRPPRSHGEIASGGGISTTYQFERNVRRQAGLRADRHGLHQRVQPRRRRADDAAHRRLTNTDHYEYILELDKDGKITGGEWVGQSKDVHPDFFWLPLKASAASVSGISYANVRR